VKDVVEHERRESRSSVDSEAENSHAQDAHDSGDEGGIGYPAHAFIAAAPWNRVKRLITIFLQNKSQFYLNLEQADFKI